MRNFPQLPPKHLISTMASQLQLLFTFLLFFTQPTKPDDETMPVFAFSWMDDRDTFNAGDVATINVIVLGHYESTKYKFPFHPNVTVNDKIGNSSFITGVSLDFDGATENWKIRFNPIKVGSFHVLIEDQHFRVLDITLSFRVNPGRMYPAAGILSWADGINEFLAGTRAEILILPKDAFGNNLSSDNNLGSAFHNYTLFASTLNASSATLLNTTQRGWNQNGFLTIEFITATAGNLLLHAKVENQTLHESPFPFSVIPGNLDVRSCTAQINSETKHFQLLSMMEGSIHQKDQYGNSVLELYAFDIEVVETGTNLTLPVADIILKDIGPGIQSFSFSLYEPGKFTLTISNKEKNTLISNMPYDFTVYIGYCDGVKSVVNGSGLNDSAAGENVKFSVFLKDAYLYPWPIELEMLQVRIVQESDSRVVYPIISTRKTENGTFDSGSVNYGVINPLQIASAPVVLPMSNDTGNLSRKASDFDVIYTPEKSGFYEIKVFCGNIPLNGDRPIRKAVTSGTVNVSLSGVVKFEKKVPKLVENEVVVQLMDSYYNPVLSQESKLKLEVVLTNTSASKAWMFSDNRDGGFYSANYLVQDIGTYELCASYGGQPFLPCPFSVDVYNSEYFPKAYNDTVSVWEDESIGFNVLEKGYFSGGKATIFEYSKPDHGSILQYGNLFRYTPYKGIYGNDSFSYNVSDINGNLASGFVDLLILSRPPRFVSTPTNLQATEDVVSPTFGGFSGFEIAYSDLGENISVTLSSRSGNVLLSPTQMKFWQPRWDELSVHKGPNEITLVGSLDAINSALQSIKYSGNENFYGGDTIQVSTTNKNGRNDIDVPIYVEPINDPPIINTPSFVIMDDMRDGTLIFGEPAEKNHFITDPDLLNFPGNSSRFLVMVSMEVSVGMLSTSLPSGLIGSTEVKMRSSNHWQPLQTFVTISNHFLAKARGIRFRGSLDDCNTILGQLSYHEGKDGAVLTLRVNDLGNYGCYPNCKEMMSVSLFAESTVNLVKHRPMSLLAAHRLGSAIAVESFVAFSLGLVMLFFMCKCASLLVHERKRRKDEEIEVSKHQDPSKS